MHIYKQLVASKLAPIIGRSEEQVVDLLEFPPNPAMGDVALPCFTLAKELRKAPQLIATETASKLALSDGIARVETAGAYVNLFFDQSFVARQTVQHILETLTNYGSNDSLRHQKIVIDFSGPNIAKHFGMGHLRGTMIGNALSNMYKALGANVTRVNHLGDWGTQFGKQTVAYLKWGNEDDVRRDPINELLKLYVKFHSEVEEHPELEDEARVMFKRLEDGDKEVVRLWRWFVEESIKEFRKLYDLLGVQFESWAGESFYLDKLDVVIDRLEEQGILTTSEGAQVVMLEELGLPPCLIKKSDGATIYPTRDLAAAVYRANTYDADQLVYVVGSEQRLHLQQVFSVLKKMGYDWADRCIHIPFGLMKIDGKKMSTRKGQIVLLEEVLGQAIDKIEAIIQEKNPILENRREVAVAVGVGAVIFNDLKVNRLHEVNFNWEDALSFEGETGPYVQYTYARCCSVLQKAAWTAQGAAQFERQLAVLTQVPGNVPDVGELQQESDDSVAELVESSNYDNLSDTEWALMKLLASLESVLELGVSAHDPSALAKYVLDVCQLFNRFYHDTRILTSDSTERHTRLTLVASTKIVIGNVLRLLGLKAPETM